MRRRRKRKLMAFSLQTRRAWRIDFIGKYWKLELGDDTANSFESWVPQVTMPVDIVVRSPTSACFIGLEGS